MSTASLRLVIRCFVAVVLCAAPVAAQSITGTIQGTVVDNQSLAVPAATVTVRNTDTNVSRVAVTDADGLYRFLNMPVGNYELTVELSGFSRYVRSGLTLALNQTAVVNVEIRPAAVSEVIEVRADAPLINTLNAEVGVRFDTLRVAELPVVGSRNIFALARSAPGVSELASGQSNFSAGGIEALRELIAVLPRELRAPMLIVVHVPPSFPSRLPEVLAHRTELDVAHAVDGERLQPRIIRIAPPDHHLVVRDGVLHLGRTPAENRHRPSIDVLFRSAAGWYDSGVVGPAAQPVSKPRLATAASAATRTVNANRARTTGCSLCVT